MTLHVHSASCVLKELWLFPALLVKKKLAQWFSTRGDFALLHTPLLLLFLGTKGHLAMTGDIAGGHYQHLVHTGQGCYQTSSNAQCSSRFPPSEKETKTFLPKLSLLLRLRNPALSFITDHSVLTLFPSVYIPQFEKFNSIGLSNHSFIYISLKTTAKTLQGIQRHRK